jgi:hypothetical protein
MSVFDMIEKLFMIDIEKKKDENDKQYQMLCKFRDYVFKIHEKDGDNEMKNLIESVRCMMDKFSNDFDNLHDETIQNILMTIHNNNINQKNFKLHEQFNYFGDEQRLKDLYLKTDLIERSKFILEKVKLILERDKDTFNSFFGVSEEDIM